ncbi:MAG: nitronate monooxygenase [Hyphomicrobiaceae bacterium]
MNVAELQQRLVLPVVVAPMFLVSGPDLLIACCKAGVVGSLTAVNARSIEILAAWLERIVRELRETASPSTPWALNIIVDKEETPRFADELALIDRFRPPIVITSFGQPGSVAKRVHAYGGLVFHDVATMRHVEKSIEAGVDGLILLTAGAGGHTGTANPFAFVPQVRKVFDGAILLAGGISDGRAVRAAEVLGADFAYMGTRFSATRESMAPDAYKSLLLSETMADVLTTDRISGVLATFMKGSISRVGLDPASLPELAAPRKPALPETLKAWRDIWSAGHGVGLIDDIPDVATLVARLTSEYEQARRT